MPQYSLIGKRVLIYKTKSIGIIERIDGNIIYVSVHGEKYKFPYPECFATTYVLDTFREYSGKIKDLTGEDFSVHRTCWNLITVNDAKGLEFRSVVAISARMTENEKYIAYTRALDELFVFEQIVDVEKSLVKEAVKRFNISGMYGRGKAIKCRNGWYPHDGEGKIDNCPGPGCDCGLLSHLY
jgi:hypothetical protein